MEKPISVDHYIQSQAQWQEELQLLRVIVLDLGLEETIKWSFPVYCHKKKNILSLGAFQKDFAIWFFQGGTLSDSHNVLVNAQKNKTKGMRSWRFQNVDDIKADILKEYIQEAIHNELIGNIYKPQKAAQKDLFIPTALQQVLDNNNTLNTVFQAAKLTHKREFCEYIDTAKRAETKTARLEKIIPMILDGISLNDKYRK